MAGGYTSDMNRALPVLALLALLGGGLAWWLARDESAGGGGLAGAGEASEEQLDEGEKPALPALPGEARRGVGGDGTDLQRTADNGEKREATAWPAPAEMQAYLAGRLVDENGLPVAWVEIHAALHERGAKSAREALAIGPVRSGLQGRFWFGRRPANLSPKVPVSSAFVGPVLDAIDHVQLRVDNFHRLRERNQRFAAGRRDVTVVVVKRPSVRLQVLDAQTRRPMPAGTWACPGYGVVNDGGWARLFGSAGAAVVPFQADGYATAPVTIAFPESGETTRAEPVLLERGFLVRGRTVAPDRTVLAKAFVVAERIGGPASTFAQFTQARGDGEGLWKLSLPVGAYRVMVFANGHAPWSADVSVQDRDQDLTATLRKFGTEGPPSALPFRWADRKTLRIPMEIEDLPATEIVAWIETIVGARIALQGPARDALKEVRLNASFRGLPVTSALELIAMLGNLEFDEATATLKAPR